MAEIIIKIGEGSNYQDGDILCAFNRRIIRCCHAEHICHPWKAGLTAECLRPGDSPAEWFEAITSQYKFERISKTEVRRTDMTTDNKPTIHGPVGKEHIDVEEFLKRRRKAKAPDGGPKLAIYGTLGAERWYGGRRDVSNAKLDAIWTKIEELTERREDETEFSLWPFGFLDIRHHLAVRVEEFTDTEANAMVASLVDDKQVDDNGSPIVVAKRKMQVKWRDLLDVIGATENDVLDRTKPIGMEIALAEGGVGYRSKPQPDQRKTDIEETKTVEVSR